MCENADVFDFKLSDEDIEKIKELETGVGIVDINSVEFIEFLSQNIV